MRKILIYVLTVTLMLILTPFSFININANELSDALNDEVIDENPTGSQTTWEVHFIYYDNYLDTSYSSNYLNEYTVWGDITQYCRGRANGKKNNNLLIYIFDWMQ